jgi:tetratricopeptide (TPR) repeat protein
VEIFVEFLKIWYPLSERKHQLELMRGTSQYIKDEHLERALLSDEDPCFIGSQRDLQRALKEQQQLLATETLEELFHNQRLTEENYQELVELVQTDRYSDAQKLLSESVSQKDRSVEKSKLTFSLQLLEGVKLLDAGKNSEALELFDVVLAEDKTDVNAWIGRGNALDYLGRYEEAIASYDRAIDFKPDDCDAWIGRGNALDNLGRYEEAIASYDRVIDFKPNLHEAWYNRGIVLVNLGRYEEAIASYDRAISIKSDKHEAWYNRGFALVNLGRYEEAIASYDRAISIKPDKHEAWHNKGCTYFKWGKYTESIDCYNQAIVIKPDKYNSWHDKGVVQFVIGNYEDALNSWQQTFQIIQQLTPHPNDIAGFIQDFLEELIPRFSLPNSQPQISTFLTQLVTIYQQAQVLPELSTSLIATLPQILAPNISDYTADEWIALWQNLLGTAPTLEMPLRLMNVAIAYKKQPAHQKRLWLGLAKEERSILNGALGLAES